MISSKKLFKENLFAVTSQFLNFARGLVFNIIFPVIMGPLLFGEYTTLVGYYYLSVGLLNGFNLAMMRRTSVAKEKHRAFYSYFFSKTIMTLFLILIISLFVFYKYSWINLNQLLLASFFALLASMQTLFVSYNISTYNNFRNTIGALSYASFSIILPLLLYFQYKSIESIIIGLIFSAMFTILLIKPSFKKRAIRFSFDKVISFSVISLFQNSLVWGIVLILSIFSAVESVAYFKVALSWVLIIVSSIPISMGVVFTSLMKAKKEDEKLFKKYVNEVLRYSFILLVPAMFGLFFVSGKMISLIYGAKYLKASTALAILSWAIIPLFVNNILVSILTAMKKETKAAKIMLSSTLALFLISIPSIYYFSLEGASFSFVIITYLVMILMVNHLRIRRQLLKNFAKPFFSSLIMSSFLFFMFVRIHSVIFGLIVILIAVLFYFVSLFLVKGFNGKDVNFMLKSMHLRR